MVLECLPGTLMSRDNLASMQKDNVCGCPFPAVFGIAPASLESVAPEYLAPEALHSASTASAPAAVADHPSVPAPSRGVAMPRGRLR